MSSQLDVLTIGRAGVDRYPLQDNVPRTDVQSFSKSLGGSPTNVAIAAARHGHRTAVITRTELDSTRQAYATHEQRKATQRGYLTPARGAAMPAHRSG